MAALPPIWIWSLLLLLSLLSCCAGECEVETGESVIIMDILESRGNQINQSTIPDMLPIRGYIPGIELKIQTSTQDYFALDGKRLRLKRPIDRDNQTITLVRLQVLCRDVLTSFQKNIPVVIRIGDINDNPPIFRAQSYETTVSELTPVGSTVFRDLSATDLDSHDNGQIEYATARGDATETDGYPYFEITLPYQGLVTVKKTLDYEKSHMYYLTVLAVDRATNPQDRLTATTTLTVHVADGDDLDPVFVYDTCTLVNGVCVNSEYRARVTSGINAGNLKILPEPILAKDRDSLKSQIRYSFVNGTPSFYDEYFEISSTNGRVMQKKVIDRTIAKRLEIIVKAEEDTELRRFATAKLTIEIQAVDNNPPVITPTSFEGYLDEGSPLGTTVSADREGQTPLKLTVTDADIAADDRPVSYTFEVTTGSFRISSDGYLIVNDASLDGDPPNPSKYTFQVIARQIGSAPGKGASTPVAINVFLNDVNDNSPRFPTLQPVRLPAGEGIRTVTQVKATDIDEGGAAEISYSVYHVSNNGQKKFRIDRESGVVEIVDKVTAGEQYSITVQATDAGGRFTQGILDVVVVPGPNTGGPVFPRDRYDARVSEGASINASLLTVTATDPEQDEIVYSLADGNTNEDFKIDEKRGTIYLGKRLDREEVSMYNLVVQATDPSGLFSKSSVTVQVTDINDQNPVFDQSSYIFKVDEGLPNAKVGNVQARDEDTDQNGEVVYSISGASDFSIDPKSGEIKTIRALDFERQQVHKLVVSAKDLAPDARFATASVTVYVNDVQDEKPYFEKELYQVTVPENQPGYDIVQVKATDPDSVKSVTYMIREGNSDLFTIDAVTGTLRTARALDYEKESSHSVVIGTLENPGFENGAVTNVEIGVQDQNDVAPVFTSVPLPIRIQDTVPLGTIVTTVVATDSDGAPPGSDVRYEISGQEKAPGYFFIDSNTGLISVKDDLRKEPDSEYRIEVKASDMGFPPLSTTATVTVYVEHIATVAPDSGLGFADSRYNVEVEENSLANTLVKTLPVINKPRGSFPIGCRIDAGNELGHFYVIENNQRDCELRLQSQSLDYEKQSKYILTVRLVTVGGLFGSPRLTTDVAIHVIDVNDNRPEFLIPPRYSNLVGNRYLGALPHDSAVGTSFLQVVAEDRDSGPNGRVIYDITADSDPYHRFRVDPTTGFLSNSKSLDQVRAEELPFRLKVVARDNPDLKSALLVQATEVLVNVIRDDNRMVMVMRDALPDSVLGRKENILRLIQDKTGMIADVEKVVSLKMLTNNTVETDTSGSDFWFYAVDPGTFRILSTNDPKVQNSILSRNIGPSLLQDVSRSLGARVERIRPPMLIPTPTPRVEILPTPPVIIIQKAGARPTGVGSDGDVSVLGAALIALASIIVILGFVGIIYHCCMWSRYVAYRERMKRLYLAPRYEPVFVEPSLKEYETQVLQMSVPLDDEVGSLSDPHLSLTLRGMEGISYIGGPGSIDSKSPNRSGDGSASAFGGGGVRSNEYSSTGATVESLDDSRSSIGHSSTARAASSLSANTSSEQGLMMPATNPLFHDDEELSTTMGEDGGGGGGGAIPGFRERDSQVALVETHHPRTSSPRPMYTAESTTEL